MKLLATALVLTLTTAAFSQTPQFTDPANLRGERVSPRDDRELPIDQGVLGLQQLLRKLNTRASILNIVAHPDDEDGGMLTLYSRGLGARVADLSLTRGEGGQNAMTGDFEDALGLLRTQELLANDRYTGVDQLFGTEVDFGFSKTKSEAFAKWTHDRVLYDAVRAIRLVRPMVITATFIGGVTDGHGQHQVSGQIAQEAFLAAADPNVFPDQIAEGILPWQALRVYARVPFADISAKGVFDYATGQYIPPHFVNYVTGKVSTTKPPTDVIVPEGTPDPLFTAAAANPSDLPPGAPSTPLSYAQFSRIGLGLQRTQISKNMRLPTSGDYDSAYTLYGSVLCADHNPIKNCLLDRNTKRTAEGLATTHVPRGFSLGSHGPSPELGFSPQGMPSPAGHGPNFFTGIDTSILAIQDLALDAFPTDMLSDIARGITAATEQFDPAHPEKIAPALAASLKVMDELIPEVEKGRGDPIAKANALHELRIKRVQLNDALVLALQIKMRADLPANVNQMYSDNPATAPADVTPVTKLVARIIVSAKATKDLRLIGDDLHAQLVGTDLQKSFESDTHSDFLVTDGDDLPGEPFPQEGKSVKSLLVQTPPNAPVTKPYFSRPNIEQSVYDISNRDLWNTPATPNSFLVSVTMTYQGTSFYVEAPVEGAFVFETDATMRGPVRIVPPISVSLPSHAQVLPLSRDTFYVSLHTPYPPQPLHEKGLHVPTGWRADLSLSDRGGDDRFKIVVPEGTRTPVVLSGYAAFADGKLYTEGYRPVGYGDLPRTNYYTPATTRIVPVDLTLPQHHTIAYLPGTGDAVPEALASINLTPTILTVADLTPTTLAKYDTVILGVRTYDAHPDLHGAPTQALLDYARNGGNVVVQYQTPEFTAADAPYPLSLGSNEKVVDETAPVVLLGPGTNSYPDPSAPGKDSYPHSPSPGKDSYHDNPSPGKDSYPEPSGSGLIADKKDGALAPGYALLTTPNRITPADFNNWIEERGHGFLATWDPHYTALTETHDPGAPSEHIAPQLPQRGGLITTTLGKGRWTYCAFALYRQLPEAVPGAYRLFLNLLNP